MMTLSQVHVISRFKVEDDYKSQTGTKLWNKAADDWPILK